MTCDHETDLTDVVYLNKVRHKLMHALSQCASVTNRELESVRMEIVLTECMVLEGSCQVILSTNKRRFLVYQRTKQWQDVGDCELIWFCKTRLGLG
jgi:hypothetical protein